MRVPKLIFLSEYLFSLFFPQILNSEKKAHLSNHTEYKKLKSSQSAETHKRSAPSEKPRAARRGGFTPPAREAAEDRAAGLLQHKPRQALAQVSPAPLLAFLGTIMKNNGHLGQKPSNHHKKKPLPSPQLSLSPPSTPPANMTFRTQVGGRWVATMPELQVATRTFCHSTEKNQNDQRTRMSPVSRKLSF